MSGVLLAWLIEAGIITWRDITKKRTVGGLPVPGDYLATFVVFGTLAAIAQTQNGQRFAVVTAWGFVVATALDVIDPTFTAGIGNALGGKATQAASGAAAVVSPPGSNVGQGGNTGARPKP